jgi:hypothetical protein
MEPTVNPRVDRGELKAATSRPTPHLPSAEQFHADYSGYDFWLSKLNQLNGNFIAAEMVKAFLNAGEYRQRFGP